jgi:hypothetical protein
MPAHADDEGKAELILVGIVEAMKTGELLLRQRVEPDARLLVLRLLGDGARARGLAGKIGMLAQEGDLGLARCRANRRHHRQMEIGDAGKRPLRVGRLRDPGGEFEYIADRRGKGRRVHMIEVAQRNSHARRTSMPRPPSL